MSVSVIIPTWNQRALLAECLASLAQQTRAADEIIIVDDGSTDDTRTWLAEQRAEWRLVALDRNRGFAAAVNAGLREAHSEYVVLLNNDMTLDSRFIEMLVARAAQGADLVAPVIVWRDEPDLIYSTGDRQCASGRPEPIGFRQQRESSTRLGVPIFGVCAGAALYRRALFDRVGLFDERFVAYFEDSDLNFRARLAGYSAVLEPEALAYHVGSASLGAKTWWRSRQCCRNHLLLVCKNMPARMIMRHVAEICSEHVHQVAMAFRAARGEFGAVKALGIMAGIYRDWLRLTPAMLRSRWIVQRSRQIDDAALDEALARSQPEPRNETALR